MATHKSLKISSSWLRLMGFKNNKEPSTFEDMLLPYWVKNGIVLFYNHGQEEYMWKIGHAEMRDGKYHCSTFRWIDDQYTVQLIFLVITEQPLPIG